VIEELAFEISLNVICVVLPIGSFGIASPTINDFFGSPKGSLKPSYRLALPGSAIIFGSVLFLAKLGPFGKARI